MVRKPLLILLATISTAVADDQTVNLRPAAQQSPAGPDVAVSPEPLPEEATDFIRGIILLLLPDPYVDEDDWGRTKRVQSGLNVRLDGLELKTSRRWKAVNHGTWQRAELRLLDPEKQFELDVLRLPRSESGEPRFRIRTQARMDVRGRQQQWANGVKLYSASGDAVADVEFTSDIVFQQEVVTTETGRELRVLPIMESSALRLLQFRLRRVGHVKGSVAREFGNSLRSLLRRILEHKGGRLAGKINQRIRRKPEQFQVPLGYFL